MQAAIMSTDNCAADSGGCLPARWAGTSAVPLIPVTRSQCPIPPPWARSGHSRYIGPGAHVAGRKQINEYSAHDVGSSSRPFGIQLLRGVAKVRSPRAREGGARRRMRRVIFGKSARRCGEGDGAGKDKRKAGAMAHGAAKTVWNGLAKAMLERQQASQARTRGN